jgi:tRNA threonylcarbamoyladenosine biosynthesis protein TsaB
VTRGVWLALEASTPIGGVAVGRDGVMLTEVVLGVQSRHSASLLPAAEYALREAGTAPAELAGIIVGSGPGSFTGVRVAAATAKGLARALRVPLLAVPSLAALAATVSVGRQPVCALFDARRDEVYAACYAVNGDGGWTTLVHPVACGIDEAIAMALQHDAVLAGEGAVRHAAAIGAAGGLLAAGAPAVPRAGALLWLAALEAERYVVADAGAWEPLYLRESGAVRAIGG